MALTKKQLAARKDITASFVPALMAGNREKIMSEWRKIVGDPTYVEDDLSENWPVQFGSWVEPFALDWHEKKTGMKLSMRGEVVVHPDFGHVSCTMDAFREHDDTVIDCKAPGMWRKIDEVISYYTPQLIVQRSCLARRTSPPGAIKAAFLIVHGGSEPVEYPVEIDPHYEWDVFARIEQFWQCCESMTQPFEMEPALAPVPAVKTYDFGTDNEWCVLAGGWLGCKAQAKLFEVAAKDIKEKVPADAMKVVGGGITVVRNKAGSLSIKEG
jgi:predicted phage-related endonuclease